MAADQERWTPDVKTIRWCFGTAHESRIKDALRDDIRDRTANLEPDSHEYWTVAAEVAIETVLYDLLEMAKREGADFQDLS